MYNVLRFLKKYFFVCFLICISCNEMYPKTNDVNDFFSSSVFYEDEIKIEEYNVTFNELNNKELISLININISKKNTKKVKELVTIYLKRTSDIDFLENEIFFPIKDSLEFKELENRYLPKLNVFIIYFFSIGIIGLFISLVINVRKKGDTISNLLIGFFLFLHSLFIINLCFFLSNYIYTFPELLSYSLSLSFLYGPLIYFYFKRNLEEYKFKSIDFLHLIPTVLLVSYLFSIMILSPEGKLHILMNKQELFLKDLTIIIALKCISLITYSYLIYKLNKKNKFNNKYQEISSWRKNLSLLIITYSVVYFLYGFSLVFQLPYTFLYPQSFLLSGIVLYIGTVAYVQPKVFSKKYIFQREDLLKIKYEKSGLTDGFSEDLKNQLLYLLNEKRVYRNNEITLNSLAEDLGATRHNVSQVINEHFGVNFFHLINKYRVNEAINIIKSDFNRNLKIIDIAYDVGFNNKVTFNKAFKSETSFTPSQYIQNLNNLGLV